MRGRFHAGKDKWPDLNQLIRERRLGILALQESHLPDDDCILLNERYKNSLLITHSSDPCNVTNNGISIVFNKLLVNTDSIETTVLIPGRALCARLKWHNSRTLTILAVYAPSSGGTDNEEFWVSLQNKLTAPAFNLGKPDIMLGDFNVVEDSLDRLPPHADRNPSVAALRNLKTTLTMGDGWREAYPDINAFTFFQTARQGGRKSRIDRIYLNTSMIPFARDWDINSSGIDTDHKLVTARISAKDLPFIGRGRWTMPIFLVEDAHILKTIKGRGKRLQNELTEGERADRTNTNNPQLAFKRFKDDIIKMVRDAAKKRVPALERKALALKGKIHETMNDPLSNEEEKRLVTSVLQD
ncbi:DNase I-like protein, partial [Coniophora puteana RWD-64-598 SS2]